nr:trehalase family glycosidase [Bacteroidetes bacterium endosymbiont of Geopemphigus sp.]
MNNIQKLWELLYEVPDDEIAQRNSLILLKHPYIVSEGRFNEIYYWDSFTICLGSKRMESTSL